MYTEEEYSGTNDEEVIENVDAQTKLLLPLRDVVTRWSSTFLMLRRALAIRPGLDETTNHRDFISQDIGEDGWVKIKECVDFLEPFASVTKHVEGFKYPTLCSVISLYNKLLDVLEDWSNKGTHSQISKDAAFAALSKITKYYEKTTKVYLVCTVLDPRFKIQYFIKNGWEVGSGSHDGDNLIEMNVKPA